MESGQERLRDILAEAVARTDPALRAAYLDEACADDALLRAKIEGLIAAYERGGDKLERTMRLSSDIGEGPGAVIGRYKLLQEIGEGGFGLVFMAEQLEPVQRKVALKIIKAGMDTREVIARFEAERQALALMDHPNIARVLDAGATETGRPYFVMELVKGIKMTDYCDQNNLSTEERLDLFIKVCHAIQHAHQKGIIHRDLKPSNVLVTETDGQPAPKVIDFGIAKATGQRLTDKTLFTRYEQMIGTPAYMSPEQAGLGSLDIDTRVDIYALGVLLYELLTGVTPFEKETLARAAFEEVRRLIRETEPPKPSTRLTELGRRQEAGDRGQGAGVRSQESGASRQRWKEVRGDLDWIVMKALEKDRRQRYETANDFAEDIERHLNHEAVLASPPSAAYRARKFARRRQGALIAAGAVAAVICAAALLGYWQSTKTREAEKRAASSRAQLKAALSQPAVVSRSTDARARGLFNGIALVERAADLSPNERFLAYTDWSGAQFGVMVRHLQSGKLQKFTGSGRDVLGFYEKTQEFYAEAVDRITQKKRAGLSGMPFYGQTWSPDSQWLTYLWITPPTLNPELRIASLDTGVARLVLPASANAYYEPMDWSPDGKWLVCRRRNQPALVLVSVPEGQIRVLSAFESDDPEHARFSPDGKYVVFCQLTRGSEPAEPRHALFVTKVVTGTTRPLNLPGNCRTPIWSPNQPVILFTTDRLSSWDLWGVRVQGDEAPSEPFPVQYGFAYHDLRLTRTGKLLVHRDVKPGDGYTIVAPRPASERLQVESLPGRIYFTMEGRLHALSVKDGKVSVTPFPSLTQPSRALHGGHRWFLEVRTLPSPGTNEARQGLYVLRDDARTDQAIQLTGLPEIGQMTRVNVFSIGIIHTGRERDRIIGWAPDAARGLDDGLISWATTKVTEPGPTNGPPPPSDIHLARVAFDSQGNITGLAEPLRSEPLVTGATTHAWSPDGRRLVYTRPGRTNMLCLLDLRTRQSSTLTEGQAPAWSPDGNWIAFHRGNASLHVIRPDGSNLRTLGQKEPPAGMRFTGLRPGFYRVVWAPDSRALVYDFWDDEGPGITYHEIFYLPLGGGEPQCLTHNLMTDASPVAWLEGEQ